MCESCCYSSVFDYRSVRKIRVKNRKLSCLYFSIIGGVLIYIIVYAIVIEKGYQWNDEVRGNVATKVKGTASVGDYNNYTNAVVYDAMDLIYPAIESNALFITTAMTHTFAQTRGICEGNSDLPSCTTDDDCDYNDYHWTSQGILTGKCASNGRCEVYSWCPLEDDSVKDILNNVDRFTVFIKNDVRFPFFGIKRTNAIDFEKTGGLTFGQNLFYLDNIIKNATNGAADTSTIASRGVVIVADIDWDCNLDRGIDKCLPEISFSRVDNEGDGVVSTGFNFRSVYYENNSTLRELKKLYGVRLVFISSGRAGKFHIIPLFITIGSGLAYLGLATIVVDFILSHCIKHHAIYKQKKYAVIDEPLIKEITTKLTTGNNHEIQMTMDEMNLSQSIDKNGNNNGTINGGINGDTNGHTSDVNGHSSDTTSDSKNGDRQVIVPETPQSPNENELIIQKD